MVIHDADAWRHRQQKAWLLPVGAPESICLFGSPGTRHDHFADGVVAERLVAYVQTEAGPLYKWQSTPGFRNDYGDVATGLCVAANRLGFNPTGMRITRKPKKCRAVISWMQFGGGANPGNAPPAGGGGRMRAVIGRPSRMQ